MSFFKNLFKSAPPVPTVTVEEVYAKTKIKPGPLLLDVRTIKEYQTAHIPGATSLPQEYLEDRIKGLSKKREIVCVCRTGSRSKKATQLLLDAGFDAVNMAGGIEAWHKAGYKIKEGKAK